MTITWHARTHKIHKLHQRYTQEDEASQVSVAVSIVISCVRRALLISFSLILFSGWFSAVHGLQCMGLIGLMLSCVYAVVLNWMQLRPPHNRLVEIVAGVSGQFEHMVCSVGVGLKERA